VIVLSLTQSTPREVDFSRVNWELCKEFLKSHLERVRKLVEAFVASNPTWKAHVSGPSEERVKGGVSITVSFSLKEEAMSLPQFGLQHVTGTSITPAEFFDLEQRDLIGPFIASLIEGEENLKVRRLFVYAATRLDYQIKIKDYSPFEQQSPSKVE